MAGGADVACPQLAGLTEFPIEGASPEGRSGARWHVAVVIVMEMCKGAINQLGFGRLPVMKGRLGIC